MALLNKDFILKGGIKSTIIIPPKEVFDYPEKILQFGTSVLLRGLCDYFVDKANRKGVFKGRIVVVKSTQKGNTKAFEEQDGLFTQRIHGIREGKEIHETIVNSSISRTITPAENYQEFLRCAENPELKIILSNTTEVGIQYVPGDALLEACPASFPAKLTALLYTRWKFFKGAKEAGWVIIPTELITENGKVLKEIVLKIAQEHHLEQEFSLWIQEANTFCDSLVDRIVPGKPSPENLKEIQEELGYEDQLLIETEPYALWAIQGNKKIKEILSFASVDEGVIIQEDIEIHRELKLRLLNGTHTLTCGLAYLLGFRHTKDMMANNYFSKLVMNLMLSEVAPAIPYKVDSKMADRFGRMVLDRFKNPFINHQLLDITVQYSAKMKMRNIPILLKYYQIFGSAPELFSMGFAAYLNFMHGVKEENGQVYGESNGEFYPIRCDKAGFFMKEYENFNLERMLANQELWGTDLTKLPGFTEKVAKYL